MFKKYSKILRLRYFRTWIQGDLIDLHQNAIIHRASQCSLERTDWLTDWLTESLTIIFMLNWKYYDEELAKIIKNWQKLSKKWLKWWKTGENDEKLAKMMKNWQKLWKTGKKWWQCWFPQECFRVFSKDEEGCIPADEIKWGWIIFIIILSNRPDFFLESPGVFCRIIKQN